MNRKIIIIVSAAVVAAVAATAIILITVKHSPEKQELPVSSVTEQSEGKPNDTDLTRAASVTEQSEEKPQDMDVTVTTSVIADATVTDTDDTISSFAYGPQVYSLDDMSAEEIFDELIKISSGISSIESPDDYPRVFSVEPSFALDDAHFYHFICYEDIPKNSNDYIESVYMEKTSSRTDSKQVVVIEMFVLNFDKGAALYELILDYLIDNFPGDPVVSESKDDDSSSWTVRVSSSESNNEEHYSIDLYKVKGHYDLYILLPTG